MGDLFSERIKMARKELRGAYKVYRQEVKKQRLLRKQAKLNVLLDGMGVVNRQISVLVYPSRVQHIKVRIGE